MKYFLILILVIVVISLYYYTSPKNIESIITNILVQNPNKSYWMNRVDGSGKHKYFKIIIILNSLLFLTKQHLVQTKNVRN